MLNYIVDASAVAAHLVSDPFTANADRLFEQFDGDYELYIPTICLVECTNVLWKRVRFESMPLPEEEALLQQLLELPFRIAAVDDVLPRALQIGQAHKLAIYDSVYIALAERYKFPLITADAKQETAARTVGVTIKPITEF